MRLMQQVDAAANAWAADPDNPLHRPWPHEALELVERALARLGQSRGTLPEPLRSFVRPEAERLLAEIARPATSHARRAAVGDRLAEIGDPRKGLGLYADGTADIFWCDVPGGRVTLEEDAGTFDVPEFYIAKYPVTFAQYRAYGARFARRGLRQTTAR